MSPALFFCQPPFSVTLDAMALAVMDMHAHLSKTEVIGLLGGQYCRERRQLTVWLAEPCDSLSTGMQCEMDPGMYSHPPSCHPPPLQGL